MAEVTEFFNPNHDARGRFTTSPAGGKHAAGAAGWNPKFEGSDRLKAQQRLLMTASKVRAGLAPDEKIALEDYMSTFQGSHAINQALLGKAKVQMATGKIPTTEHQKQTTLKSVRALEHVFDKTPLNAVPLRLVRGVGSVDKSWGKPGSLTGATLSTDALSSTTMDSDYATYAARTAASLAGKKPGGSVLMVMYAPENTVRALPASDIRFANAKEELGLKPPNPGHEVILPPGTQVKVHSDVAASDSGVDVNRTVFDRVVTVEVLPEDPDYRQPLSYRDNLSAAVTEAVSLFFNPHHDARGRFTSGPGGKRLPPPKNAAERELDDLIAGIRAKKAANAHLQAIHQQAKDSITGDETAAVRFYEGNFQRCGAMNDLLRFGKIREKNSEALDMIEDGEAGIRAHTEALKGAFTYAPKLSRPTTVYRAVRNMPGDTDPKQIAAMEAQRQLAQDRFDFKGMSFWDDKIDAARIGGDMTGKVLKDEGFMSTTADESRAKGYMAHSAPGEKPAMLKLTAPAGTPVIAVDSILGKDGGVEAELLLQPGTSYRVTGDVIENGQRVITGEIIAAESNLSALDRSTLLPIVSLFFNPYHDERGRFATSPASNVTKPDGGFTFDPVKGRMASTGYAVSPFPERSKVLDVENLKPKELRKAITDYVAENMDLAEKENHYVGGWRDPQPGGKVYLDISIVVKDKEEAIRIAKAKDQIAVFDFQTFESIQVDANAKSGQK